MRIDLDETAEDLDHPTTPEERLRIVMMRQRAARDMARSRRA